LLGDGRALEVQVYLILSWMMVIDNYVTIALVGGQGLGKVGDLSQDIPHCCDVLHPNVHFLYSVTEN
jgi:hypothetical protein